MQASRYAASYIATLFGVLSLAAFIPFSGFFASAGIASSLQSNALVYVLISGRKFLTSFFIFRWFSYSLKGTKNISTETNYITLPKTMVYPMVLLAVLTVAASAAFLFLVQFLSYGNYLNYLSLGQLSIAPAPAIVLTVLVVAAAFLSYNVYYKNKIKARSVTVNTIIYMGPIMNRFYAMFASITNALADGVASFDYYLSDMFDAIGRVTLRLGYR